MTRLDKCKIEWGVIEYHSACREGSDLISYLEYRIDTVADICKIEETKELCVAHAPDPQDPDWFEIIRRLSKFEHVAKINTHARSEETFLLCESCGSRLVSNKLPLFYCDRCGNPLEGEMSARAQNNSMDLLIKSMRSARM